ncbi:CopG family transcriptional regulator [Novosphingobium sp. BL-8H]|uniref:CopG family transcriptional regulator n=1 Tax=Novosphingobium sp. BL-8H TaxID=3127640 RepID=UPI0037574052
MQTRKSRHQLYLPDHLSARLDALAAEPNNSKTAIMTDALGAWFERREDLEAEQQFGKKLERQARAVERMERRLDYLTEVVGLFVRHQLTLTAHHPAFDVATRKLGQARYDAFVRLVAEQAARSGSEKAGERRIPGKGEK